MLKNNILFLTGLILLTACGAQEQQETKDAEIEEPELEERKPETVQEDVSAYIETASKITREIQLALLSEVQNAIEEGDIAHAVNYCNAEALALTQQLNEKYDVEVSRVSHKYRNPVNKASDEELDVIAHYLTNLDRNDALEPIVREQADGSIVFYAPILLASPLCMQCHGEPGEDIKTEDFITIQMLYPDDKAYGFNMGDLRGLWRVRFGREMM